MSDELLIKSEEEELEERLASTGSPGEAHRDIPKWLLIFYWTLPIWGVIWFFVFLSGNDSSFLDRGAWSELQESALTTWDAGHYGVEEVSTTE